VPGTSAEQNNPNNVKVVLGQAERAIWFSRCPVIYDRDRAQVAASCYRHLGIYAYRREVLLRYAALPPSPLEQLEKLEQLRALEAGIGMACAIVPHASPGIDVRADYDAFLARQRQNPVKVS
jgi:3-deoxy-manno-octulosonate cytidylyltransferase (CMP-KDO synthetase)